MSRISDEIKAKQEAYAARPYAVQLRTSHFSATFRFDTLREAIEYLDTQYHQAITTIKQERYRSFDAYQTCLILPGNVKVQAREFIGDSLSSY